ncbi:pentapeptide repeat-containing protein, partial [Loktanella sp. IMCC34160]|uniref:pentapeptide repeat-containing protein n=1 Tax=Loktanella sp. IMCC34160 TaxID=2510646 RepID=UPI001F5E1D90
MSLTLLFFLAYVAAFAVAIYAITSVFGEDATGPNLGVGTLVAALLGAPFLIWRTMVAQKTVDHAAKSLFNEKINAAVQDLYSQRQVTWTNDDEEHFNAWQDDVVKRNAAIDRLLGLAEEAVKDNPKEVHRIASMLSVYVRELSKEPELRAKTPPKGVSPDELYAWAIKLEVARSDMEKAVQTLGKLRRLIAEDDDKPKIDLRDANLQRMDLRSFDFDSANLSEAKLQGADLSEAKLQGADLSRAELQGAILFGAELKGADLSGAELQGAILSRAKLQGAILFGAELQGADLSRAELQGAILFGAELKGADLSRAVLQGANLSGAKLQGAILFGAELQGADLSGAELFDDIFAEARLFGAVDIRAIFHGAADWQARLHTRVVSMELLDASAHCSSTMIWHA